MRQTTSATIRTLVMFSILFRRLRKVAGFSVAACLLAACSHGADTAPPPPPGLVHRGERIEIPAGSPLRQRIVVAPVALTPAPRTLDFPATIEADAARQVDIRPPLAGRLLQLDVHVGERVQRGQLLATIASGDMDQAYADVAKAHDALDLARKTLARTRGVEAAGGAALKDTQAAQSGVDQAAAEYRRARNRVLALGGSLDGQLHTLQVRAPIDGTVITVAAAPGVYLNDPTATMLSLANIDAVRAVAHVAEDQAGLVHAGQAAMVRVPTWPGRVFRGKVESVAAVFDADTGSVKLRIALDNRDHALKPNMYANASVAVPQPAQVTVPESALLMNNDATTVLVEVAPWTFERRTVRLAWGTGDRVRVAAGLAPGTRIVVAGGVLLND